MSVHAHNPCQSGVPVWVMVLFGALIGLPLGSPAHAQTKPDADELGSELDDVPEREDEDVAAEATEPETPAAEAAEEAVEKAPPPPLPPPPPPAVSPFVFTLKGTVAGTLFLQDTPILTGQGGAALLGPSSLPIDSWFMGGDVRQSRLSFNIRGPEVIGAIPTASLELEMYGGNQVTTVPAQTATLPVRDAMGVPNGSSVTAPVVTSSAQGDESLLPRLRTAYIELNWDTGTNLIRVGQYHNLLLAMVSASGAHPATLGYGGGQLGWRSPGIMYSHKWKLGEDAALDTAVQLNRNSWQDNVSSCAPNAPPTAAPPVVNCLPSGISFGEAGLPQIQARLLFSGGKEESPFPHYAPTVWQFHVVGHYDQKDLSGVGYVATAPARDTMDTYAIEAGGKLKLGPVLVAANGWWGQNTGSVFGMMFQMQGPDKPDVTGFGAWGQVGFSLTKNISLWAFGGIDKPNRTEALAAQFARLQNVQLAGMLAYVDGPLVLTLEWFNVATTNYDYGAAATATMPARPPLETTNRGNQPSFTMAYMF